MKLENIFMETFTQACSHEEESELMQNIFEDESLMLESYEESTETITISTYPLPFLTRRRMK